MVRDTQLVADQIRELRPAGHRAADRVDAVRREAPGELRDEWTQLRGMIEERAELEPRSAVIARLHQEVAAAAREQRCNGVHHGSSMSPRGLIASCDQSGATIAQHLVRERALLADAIPGAVGRR